jgi:hypothetical protein
MAPVLGYPQPAKQFAAVTDVNKARTAGVLSQVQHGRERVVDCFSKSVSLSSSGTL